MGHNKRSSRTEKTSVAQTAGLFSSLTKIEWICVGSLLVVLFLAYQPAWHGGLLWDDTEHMTAPGLESLSGLLRIWFDVKATWQYYPLVHSVFWVGHKLWGESTVGYHMLNLLFHAVSVVLVVVVVKRLAVAGAVLAGAIFALHPVHVDSVAWISEIKNTLSTIFYLAAMVKYLDFDKKRSMPAYWGSLALFFLALASKTATVTFPAAVLVILWWKRGELNNRRDVVPLLPFFVLAAAAGLMTSWVEHNVIGAEGEGFEFTFVERFLIAGRAVWWYLQKLFWPVNLSFLYTRWRVSAAVWWQYLFPVSALVVLGLLWMIRRRWRGPLAAMLFFVGTLFPVLGFFNVYMFRFSFVADHLQYLADLGIIVWVAALFSNWLAQWPSARQPIGHGISLLFLTALVCMTWQESRAYVDIETLYQSVLSSNPSSWLAHNNLGVVLFKQGQVNQAFEHYKAAIELNPNYADAHNNFANALAERGRGDEAVFHYRRALEIKPRFLDAHNNLGLMLVDMGRIGEAISHYKAALDIDPYSADVHYNFGVVLADHGQVQEAVTHFKIALEIRPDLSQAREKLDALSK